MTDQTSSSSHVLLLEAATSTAVRPIEEAAHAAGLTVRIDAHWEAALTRAELPEERPRALLLVQPSGGADDRVASLRSRIALAGVPLIGLSDQLTDLAFEEASSVGIDDCCALARDPLGRLLRALGKLSPVAVQRRSERVLVADPSADTRMLVARVFHNAGFEVAFALDDEQTVELARSENVTAVICAAALRAAFERAEQVAARPPAGETPKGAAEPPSAGPTQPPAPVWILNAPPKQIAELRAMLAGRKSPGLRAAVHDAFSPAANLLFVANELLHRPGQDARKSERVLYGTSVAFRSAGSATSHVGYSYNISAGGLYVRTLAPPTRGDEVWLELVPPRSDRRVHLEARVVWARQWGAGQGATVPPGFGVEITGVTAADALRYGRGYESFLADRAAS